MDISDADRKHCQAWSIRRVDFTFKGSSTHKAFMKIYESQPSVDPYL